MSQPPSPPPESPYWCFISYRHADDKAQDRAWASWLHEELSFDVGRSRWLGRVQHAFVTIDPTNGQATAVLGGDDDAVGPARSPPVLTLRTALRLSLSDARRGHGSVESSPTENLRGRSSSSRPGKRGTWGGGTLIANWPC